MSTLRTIVLVIFGFAVVPALFAACGGSEDTTDTSETGGDTM